MFLDVVREELVSRGSNKNMLGSDFQESTKNINIPTFEENNLYGSRANENSQRELSNSFRQSSAQSSRSFNGFEQINQY